MSVNNVLRLLRLLRLLDVFLIIFSWVRYGSLQLLWAPGTTGHRPALLKHAETWDFPKSPIDNN